MFCILQRAEGSTGVSLPIRVHSGRDSQLRPESVEHSLPSTARLLGEEYFREKPSDLDPVDRTRLQSTNFLFDRYSYIDIKTPDTFSSADLMDQEL